MKERRVSIIVSQSSSLELVSWSQKAESSPQNLWPILYDIAMLGFTIRRGIQTSISVPVKGFFSKFGCELHWGVVQLGQDHGAPPAPCRGAQGCTGVHRGAQGCTGAHFPQLFCLLS